ncbi:DUF6233 domain-containing protein [Streptomyces griseorubiginosus]|uniref:DUF6233 domain-containing protein n=1 Tax=Streptomyces griseorubiginosus TaxID=67304 RepID=UPI0036266BF3
MSVRLPKCSVSALTLLHDPVGPWLVEWRLPQRNAVDGHVGGCWNAGSRSGGVKHDHQVRRALVEGVTACPQCLPDTELGIID